MTIDELFRSAVSYLTASIELTSGRSVTVTQRGGRSAQAPPCVWWQQKFTIANRTGAIVFGVADPFWTRLFASGEGDQAMMKEILFEGLSQTALRLLDDVQQSIRVAIAPADAGETRAPSEADLSVRRLYAQCEEPPAAGDLIIAIDKFLMDRLRADRPSEERPADHAAAGQEYRESLGKLGSALTNGTHETGALASRLLDLPLPVSIRIAQTSIPIKDVLRLAPGSVVELGKYAGEPVEIVVHGAVLAKGEVVSVKGYYGVRVTEIVAVSQRLAAVNAPEQVERGATVVSA